MSARASVSLGTRRAANADLFEGSPWSLEAARGRISVQLRVVYPTDFQEVLSVAEDLWMRIVRTPGLSFHADGTALLIECMRTGNDPSVQELLAAVQNPDRYRWSQLSGGEEDCESNGKPRPMCLIQDILWTSNILTIKLISRKSLERYVGCDAVLQFQALLARIQGLAQTMALSDAGIAQSEIGLGLDYWQQQMRTIKQSMDAAGI